MTEPVPPTIAALDADWPLRLDSFAGLEAQIAAIADDIAYNNHDVDDGLRAGMFDFDDLMDLPLIAPILEAIQEDHGELGHRHRVHETVRSMIGVMVDDLLAESRRRLNKHRPTTADDVRSAGEALIAFSEPVVEANKLLKQFLFRRMYRHYKVNRMATKAKRVVGELFDLFLEEPNTMPTNWQIVENEKKTDDDEVARARRVCDYIAGMTDRFALEEHERLFDVKAKT